MDITFKTEEGIFNYRVCAIIMHENKLLAMRDEQASYFYLPGGRVKLHETAEQAILREIKEELQVNAEIIRPLWFNENFFTQVVNEERYHEVCLYFLLDISKTELLEKGDKFSLTEGKELHNFRWLTFEQLKSEQIYPLFIKDRIFNLPNELTMITEVK